VCVSVSVSMCVVGYFNTLFARVDVLFPPRQTRTGD